MNIYLYPLRVIKIAHIIRNVIDPTRNSQKYHGMISFLYFPTLIPNKAVITNPIRNIHPRIPHVIAHSKSYTILKGV